MKIKLSYISGLRPVVSDELLKHDIKILDCVGDSVYVEFSEINFGKVKHLKSVARAYVVSQDEKYNPTYISNHKSILDDLIAIVLENKTNEFKTFRINCAGSDSLEVKNIFKYVAEKYNLPEKEVADLKIHFIKSLNVWEIGIQITPRPLSVRGYRSLNMSGAMDPTIAYAVNSFCNLQSVSSLLNIFSGSATLLIEAGLEFENLDKIVGFDNDKKHLSLSIQNIKKAGLIKRVQVKEADIFDNPDFGKFDAIVSDLPFGMAISKNEDLEDLYKTFVEYSEVKLNPNGRVVIYTSKYELIERIITKSHLSVIQTLELKIITNANVYLNTKIIVCELRK